MHEISQAQHLTLQLVMSTIETPTERQPMTTQFNFNDHFKIITVGFDRPTTKTIPCPNQAGNWDCTPFCDLCGGEQEIVTKIEVMN
jgi:hypothetical protein